MRQKNNNLRVVGGLVVIIAGMLGIVAYSPTIYRWFCSATGYGGTTQRVLADDAKISKRMVTVRFDTNVAPNLPWRFTPDQGPVKVFLGEQKLVFFTAENLSDRPIVAHATYNVTPGRSGPYFKKIQCFCFHEERLKAHQKVEMPVVFFVDPSMAKDAYASQAHTITLSYTMFQSIEPQKGKDLARLRSGPDPSRGKRLFAQTCSACHSFDRNKIGPDLAGVFGRKAGTALGYPYSPALKKARLHWTADNLDQWLTSPKKFIPGVTMPVSVVDPFDRRDIIAYLKQTSDASKRAARPRKVAQRGSNSVAITAPGQFRAR